jgi:group II intron reverse transcriptase/maturase
MKDLLKMMASPKIMNMAWQKYKNDPAPWDVHISRQAFEKNMVAHLLQLSESLKDGTYRPDPVRFFWITKGDGGQRKITACYLRDKLAQRAALLVLTPLGEKVFHPNSFGYRPGRSIDMALAKVREHILCQQKWVVDGDIESCFDNIPHKPLIKSCSRIIPDRHMVRLIKRWLDAAAVKKGLMSPAVGLPQGMVLSPFLCNLYLTRWDQFISAKKYSFVRFSDDFLVFSKSKPGAEAGLKIVEKGLKNLGLKLNRNKTKISECGPSVKFLGKKLPSIKI